MTDGNLNTEGPRPCSKCGAVLGWEGPTYRLDHHSATFADGSFIPGREWLVYRCKKCGYLRREPTLDTPPPPPPRLPAREPNTYGPTIRLEVTTHGERRRSWFERWFGRC